MGVGCGAGWRPAGWCRCGVEGWSVGCGSRRRQVRDLDEVVGEDAVAAPGSGAGEPVEAAAVEAVSAFEVADASFAAGAPPDEPAERPAVFVGAAGGVGSALAGDGDGGDPEGVQ